MSRYLRDFEVGTIGLKETSRRCSNADCHAKLRDTVLDWEVCLLCLISDFVRSFGQPNKFSKETRTVEDVC